MSRLKDDESDRGGESSTIKYYLDWLAAMPWGVTTPDNQDLALAVKVLDEDHYGLKDVKERVLEFIAVNILKQGMQGKIVCFVGPPGVGKTSMGKSIARALDRKFYRVSLGGMDDTCELVGHRRTYVGAMPGKVIDALKQTEVSNPLILLDEVDKLGRGGLRGNPQASLLEILDPVQNHKFRDAFLDVPVDLSKVLFICTANQVDTISGPLRDRIEVINIAGYASYEKIAIAKTHHIPTCLESSGLRADQVELEDVEGGDDSFAGCNGNSPSKRGVLSVLVRDYTREAGVRSLFKYIEKIYRKAALKILRDNVEKVKVTEENLSQFVGEPLFQPQNFLETAPPGVACGLAWGSNGGSTLMIEATGWLPQQTTPRSEHEPTVDSGSDETIATFAAGGGGNSGSFKMTGRLGETMSESSQIALSVARMFVRHVDPKNDFLERAHIHLHACEGAVPKDGPSAGVTMTSSLISLALGRPLLPALAMTGEMTLTGKVSAIGGVKEKIAAAIREGIQEVILPMANLGVFEELEPYYKDNIIAHFVDNYFDLHTIAFGLTTEEVDAMAVSQPCFASWTRRGRAPITRVKQNVSEVAKGHQM
eukprot:GHVN01067138.1.p1 GENE.GHVN01067138.1~~GHVN01067138.1.p1  ORF type:complete len:594 (-),score=69.98 GHVN01067138.1:1365-3146(-)